VGRARIERLLGLSRAESDLLTGRACARLGRRAYLLRLATFTLATTPLVRLAIPRSLRLRAIASLLFALLPGPSENLLYARGLDALQGSASDG
jgi:hypothetical protein